MHLADPEHLAAALEQAAADADLVLLVAGSAKGAGDHAVSVIGAVGQIVARGVAIRPGHPVVLGLAGSTPVISRFSSPVELAKSEKRWQDGFYLDKPEEWDDPYRFFCW